VSGRDAGTGICLLQDYLAVVGGVASILGGYWHTQELVMLLDKYTGDVVKTWVSVGDEEGPFYDCISLGNKLYAVGYSHIYIFDKDLRVVKHTTAEVPLMFITSDGGYLYTGGGWNDSKGRVEIRNLDLNLVRYKEMQKYGIIWSIEINPVIGEVWAVGDYKDSIQVIGVKSLMTIFDKKLNIKKVVNSMGIGSLFSVCFDSIGYAYVVGSGGIARFDKGGNLEIIRSDVWGNKIACINEQVYVFNNEFQSGFSRATLFIFNKNFNIVKKLVLSKANANSGFVSGKVAYDGHHLYVAGWEAEAGQKGQRIVIYSISVDKSSGTKIYK